jgi:hypothetical protein
MRLRLDAANKVRRRRFSAKNPMIGFHANKTAHGKRKSQS